MVETLEEKVGWELHKDTVCGLEQILKVADQKTMVLANQQKISFICSMWTLGAV